MALLDLRKISKNFGAIKALTGCRSVARPGEVLGLMGDNGAGKSTLVKIIAGNFPPTVRRDRPRRRGRCISTSRSRRAQKGIEIVYQDLALCDNLTAAANVFLGRELTQVASARSSSSTIRAMYQQRRRALRRAEVGDAAARPRAPHVGRPAPGGRDRPHAPVEVARSC